MDIIENNGILFFCQDETFTERYTRNKFKFKYGGQFNSNIAKRYWDAYINNDISFLQKQEYSLQELIKQIHCINCDKIKINNWRKYCYNCQYY